MELNGIIEEEKIYDVLIFIDLLLNIEGIVVFYVVGGGGSSRRW